MNEVENVVAHFGNDTERPYDPKRDFAHACVPMRVTGATADEVERRANACAAQSLALIEATDGVEWPPSVAECAYAFLINGTNALRRLDPADRMALLAAAPFTEELRTMLSEATR